MGSQPRWLSNDFLFKQFALITQTAMHNTSPLLHRFNNKRNSGQNTYGTSLLAVVECIPVKMRSSAPNRVYIKVRSVHVHSHCMQTDGLNKTNARTSGWLTNWLYLHSQCPSRVDSAAMMIDTDRMQSTNQ